jgi:hypothetical protein
MELTVQERQMIEVLREWTGASEYGLHIERQDGAWNITLTEFTDDKKMGARGSGATFDEAWDRMDPLWA